MAPLRKDDTQIREAFQIFFLPSYIDEIFLKYTRCSAEGKYLPHLKIEMQFTSCALVQSIR